MPASPAPTGALLYGVSCETHGSRTHGPQLIEKDEPPVRRIAPVYGTPQRPDRVHPTTSERASTICGESRAARPVRRGQRPCYRAPMNSTARPGRAAAITVVALLAILTGCGSIEYGLGSAPEAAVLPERDPLAFLDPLRGGTWEGTVGTGDASLQQRVTLTDVFPERLSRLSTEVRIDGAWQLAIDGQIGWDPARGRVTYRAWSVDGAYFDGVARAGDDGSIILLYDLTSTRGSLRLQLRYAFEGTGTCAWESRLLTLGSGSDDQIGAPELFDSGVLRRAVPASTDAASDDANTAAR